MATVLDFLKQQEGIDAADPWLAEKIEQLGFSVMDKGDENFVLIGSDGERVNNMGTVEAALNSSQPIIQRDGKAFLPGQDSYEALLKVPEITDLVKKLGKDAFPVDDKGRQLISQHAADQINKATGGYDEGGFFAPDGPWSAASKTVLPLMGAANVFGALTSGATAGSTLSSFAPTAVEAGGTGVWQSLGSSLSQNAALQGGSFADIVNAMTGGASAPAPTGGIIGSEFSLVPPGSNAGIGGAGTAGVGLQVPASAGSTLLSPEVIGGATGIGAAGLTTGATAGGIGLTATGATGAPLGDALLTPAVTGGATGIGAGGLPVDAANEAILDAVRQWSSDIPPMDSTGATNGLPAEATTGNTITPSARDVPDPVSNTQRAAQELLNGTQPPAPVTEVDLEALAKAGASKSTIQRFSEWLTTHDKLAGAAVTTAGGIIGGIGKASMDGDTMERKAELEAQTLKDVLATKQSNAAENAFTGNVGIRPAATRTPLKRLSTGENVYSPGGLLNSIRRTA